jgi:hypothetical protein
VRVCVLVWESVRVGVVFVFEWVGVCVRLCVSVCVFVWVCVSMCVRV